MSELSAGEKKIQEYIDRINGGESKEAVTDGLSESFRDGIEKGLKSKEELAETSKQNKIRDDAEIERLRRELGIKETSTQSETFQGPKINYIEVIIDDEFMQKNLMPNGALRMQGGQANWNGEVDLMKYVMSENLSPEHRKIAEDKIEKHNAGQEKSYQHESHHIRNRENNLTPHVAAENLREFLAFRVLDELSAFAAGELYNQDLTIENILTALQKSRQAVENSYYGEPFINDAKWYSSKHRDKKESFSRQINPEKYHQIMRQYFNVKGKDILPILQGSDKMPEFTKIVNELIIKLDDIMIGMNPNT